MLVIARWTGTGVLIGDGIRVSVRSIPSRSYVKIGIEAPPNVKVLREELGPPADTTESRPPPPGEDGFRVVVVEDDPVHARLIDSALRRVGVNDITTASSGEVAIRQLLKAGDPPRPDLIMLDLMLPDVPGLDVLSALRARDHLRRTPIIVLSCEDSERNVSRCLDAGANAFLVKEERYERFRDSVGRAAEFWQRARRVA